MSKFDLSKKLLLFGFITFVTGQIFFYPFGTDFRLALSPVVFAFVLLYFPRMPIIPSCITVGLCVFTGRFTLDYFNYNLEIMDIILKHYPGGLYYILYGFFFYLLDIRRHAEKPLLVIVLLAVIDSLSNIIELIIRNQIFSDIQIVVSSLIIVAFIRNFITVLVYWSIKLYNVLILKRAHYNRYIELLIFISNLKAELFYLKKSMQDIENVMRNSYSLYMEMNTPENKLDGKGLEEYKEKALSLARDIHEVKKDYQRVIAGIEKLLPDPLEYQEMNISEIFEIIRNNSARYIESTEKSIKLKFQVQDNFQTREYYSLVSILNNLIFNAIDATGDSGEISVKECIMDDSVCITVSDTGTGISPQDLEVIFEPGFSTKFDEITGTMSTGLGLTHVKSIVEHLKGKITVDSIVGVGTTFEIRIPVSQLISKGE